MQKPFHYFGQKFRLLESFWPKLADILIFDKNQFYPIFCFSEPYLKNLIMLVSEKCLTNYQKNERKIPYVHRLVVERAKTYLYYVLHSAYYLTTGCSPWGPVSLNFPCLYYFLLQLLFHKFIKNETNLLQCPQY